jgi:uncharacterized protein
MAKMRKDEMMSNDMDSHGGYCDASCGCGPAYGGVSPHWSKCFAALTIGLFFLGMSVIAFQQIFGNGWFENIKAEVTSQPYARTITVTGEGKITAKPDLARVSLSVVSTGATVEAVSTDNNQKMAAIAQEIKNLGIKAEDIQTSQYNLYPQYDYNNPIYLEGDVKTEAPRILGYNLSQSLDVKIRDLALIDQVLDKGTAAGANQVGALSFEIDDDGALKQDARDEAFKIAREKADKMASAAGVRIGRVVTFSEGFGGPMPVYANFSREMAQDSASAVGAAVEVGSQELAINVSVTYEIE